MKTIKILSINYRPGYGDMLGEYHEASLRKDRDGKWTYICCDRENHRAPKVTKVYTVEDEAVERFEDFLSKKGVLSLGDRSESNLFATDYSPWSWYIDYEEKSFGKIRQRFCNIEEYREYSTNDYKLLNTLCDQFTALRGEKITETTDK